VNVFQYFVKFYVDACFKHRQEHKIGQYFIIKILLLEVSPSGEKHVTVSASYGNETHSNAYSR